MRILLTAAAVALLAAPAAGAAVNVRVEGATATIADVDVAATGPAVTKSVNDNNGNPTTATCQGDTAAAALERAVGGDWTGTAYSFGLSVDRIRTEANPFDSQRYFQFDVNFVGAFVGACDQAVSDGDRVLFYTACGGATAGCFADNKPLELAAPAKVTAGVPFTVTVTEHDDFAGTSQPASGASVGGKTTGADGKAEITLTETGTTTLTATKAQQVRDSAQVTVEPVPVYSVPTPPPTTTGPPPASEDRAAPVSRIEGIREQQRFRRKRAPRELRATITDASALRSVQLSLTRQVGRRCTAFDGRTERFKRIRCGRHPRFGIGTAKTVSFLLPARLRKGRYVFDVVSTDVNGNAETLARGRNRVVFRVR